ncbi:MAG: helicase HerA-like domain-containing protein [Caulobacteraceae bacterium]
MEPAVSPDGIMIGFSDKPERLRLERANRHGVVAGATGTGKTVTLQIMAQAFSDAGVPVFAADVKGDLSGISQAGAPNEKMLARAAGMNLELTPAHPPVMFWDLFGKKGHPIRTTVSEMGPLLLSRMLELNDVQEGVMNIVFRVCDEQQLMLLDLKDLQAALTHIAQSADTIGIQYGNVAPATVGTIQRKLLTLETQGGSHLFGEPALQLADLMRVDASGKGMVSILAADTLIQSPALYSTFLLWLVSELFEDLPEVGDPDKPKLVFFFDEAHLLFRDAPKELLNKIEQVVRLIRSKGVGIYFVTQNPADIPDTVLAQLGNRIQHALRAYTPAEQKGLKAAAESFRPNPAFDTAATIQVLGVGEALVSVLDAGGVPTMVAQTKIRPPASRLGPATDAERQATQDASPLKGVYDTVQDRDSAFEVLQRQAAAKAAPPPAPAPAPQPQASAPVQPRYTPPPQPRAAPAPRAPAVRRSSGQSVTEVLAKSVIKAATSREGMRFLRGILGGFSR